MHTGIALFLIIASKVKLPGRWLRKMTLFSKTHQPLGQKKTEGLCCQLGWKSEAALLSFPLLVPLCNLLNVSSVLAAVWIPFVFTSPFNRGDLLYSYSLAVGQVLWLEPEDTQF